LVGGDITAFSSTDFGVREKLDLTLQKSLLWWSKLESASTYDVVRGSLDALISSAGDFSVATDACLAQHVAVTRLPVPESPGLGQSLWYLVRAAPGGSYDTGEPSQSGSRDAEIAASGHDCP